MKEACFFTIFGYSAPVSDIDARNLILEVWSDNPSQELAQIELIDIKFEKEACQVGFRWWVVCPVIQRFYLAVSDFCKLETDFSLPFCPY